MDSIPIMEHDALQPAVPSVRLALEHVDSDDYFQQLLSIDAALEALDESKNTLMLQLYDMNSKGLASESVATKASLAELNRLIQRFKKLQTAARDGFNLRARSLRKDKVGIMDLPNELLWKIFDSLKWRLDDPNFFFAKGDYDAYRPAIQHVRLTCRLFRQMSSHLLVRRLDISPSLSSLKHLEEVTNHPEISRGERVFRIDLKYYSATIARDFQSFAVMCDEKLREKIKDFERLIEFSDEGSFGMELCQEEREDVEDGLVKARGILSSWEPFTNGLPIEEGASLDAAALALQKGHELYRELFQQQQNILQNGHFARTVAEAAARSGSEVWLSMSDTAPSPHENFSRLMDRFGYEDEDETKDLDLFSDPDSLVQSSLIQTQAWCRTKSDEGEIPQSLLYELPLAMRAAGALLAGVGVNINFPFKLNLGMSQAQLSGLSEVAEGMVAFTFRMNPADSQGPQLRMGEMGRLYAYLCAAMGPQSVPFLWLSLPPMFDDNGYTEYGWNAPFRFPTWPLLNCPHWHRLRTAQLEHLKMKYSDLEHLTSMLQSEVRFRLRDIYLENGTWAAALDCLRSKAACGSDLLTPNGPDCRRMIGGEYSDIFDVDPEYHPFSKAAMYINSVEGVKNPCRRSDEAPEANLAP